MVHHMTSLYKVSLDLKILIDDKKIFSTNGEIIGLVCGQQLQEQESDSATFGVQGPKCPFPINLTSY